MLKTLQWHEQPALIYFEKHRLALANWRHWARPILSRKAIDRVTRLKSLVLDNRL